MTLPSFSRQRWILIFFLGAIVALGIWAFGVDKPPRVVQIQIAMRSISEQQAELGILETDHEGVEHFYEADGFVLDLSLVDRPRSLYSEPIVLSNDEDNAPSKVRITQRGLSDEEIILGFRSLRPNRRYGSTRFPSHDPVTLDQVRSETWTYSPPLNVRVVYHQPLVNGVRIVLYVAVFLGLIFAIALVIWRRWMS